VDALLTLVAAFSSWYKTSAELRLENLALRQQLGGLRRSAPKRLRLTPADRAFWVWMKAVFSRWQDVLMIVKTRDCVGLAQERISPLLDVASAPW
jgi:hypothetical protein